MTSLNALLRVVWLIAPLALAIRVLVQAWRDPRLTRAFWLRSVLVLVLFLAAMVGMVLMLAWLAPGNPVPRIVPLLGVILAWTGLCSLWLIRLAPRRRLPPAWMMKRWGPLDWILLALVAVSAASL